MPAMTLQEYNQAVNRLEVLRGLADVPAKLHARLIRRFKAYNVRMECDDGVWRNFRIFDMGPA